MWVTIALGRSRFFLGAAKGFKGQNPIEAIGLFMVYSDFMAMSVRFWPSVSHFHPFSEL